MLCYLYSIIRFQIQSRIASLGLAPQTTTFTMECSYFVDVNMYVFFLSQVDSFTTEAIKSSFMTFQPHEISNQSLETKGL